MSNMEVDLLLAIQLQEQFEEELREQRKVDIQSGSNTGTSRSKTHSKAGNHSGDDQLSVSLVDPVWELIDPVPDVYSLFCTYNDQFFWGKLHAVAVSWSPRMTSCAGVCSYERRGGLCSIRLSVPLLKLRPRSDLVETLLHEMIHAYLFVTANNRDRDGHGPEFHKHMYRINAKGRTKISVYHSFHDEVAVYRQHVWQCSGPCRRQRPYFGLVKRSMNRAPGSNDRWWAQHKAQCGGEYRKISEPEGFQAKGGVKRKAGQVNDEPSKRKNDGDIRDFFSGSGKTLSNTSASSSSSTSGGSGINAVSTLVPRVDNEGSSKPAAGVKDRSVFGKTKTGPSSSGVSGVKSNINGFSSTSSAAVTSVGISNASRSNVVGFNKGLNVTNNGNNSSNKSRSNIPERKGTSHGAGGGLAGFGSSGTILVKPKPSATRPSESNGTERASEQTKTDVEQGSNKSAVEVFSGSGHVLSAAASTSKKLQRPVGHSSEGSDVRPGTSGRPVSRLLAEYEVSSKRAQSKNLKNANLLRNDDKRKDKDECTGGRHSISNCSQKYGKENIDSNVSGQRIEEHRQVQNTDEVIRQCEDRLENSYLNHSVTIIESDSEEESSTDDTSGQKECPLCNCMIDSGVFSGHISECIGDLSLCDFDDTDESKSQTEDSLSNSIETGHSNFSTHSGKGKEKKNPETVISNNTTGNRRCISGSSKDRTTNDAVEKSHKNVPIAKLRGDAVLSSASSASHKKTERRGKEVSQATVNRGSKAQSAAAHDSYSSESDTDDEFDDRYANGQVYTVVQECLDRGSLTSSSRPSSGPVVAGASGAQQPASGSGDTKKYPCPVCNELYTEEYITATHLNTHFT